MLERGTKLPDPVLSARGRTGHAKRSGNPSLIEAAYRDLAAAKLEQYIERVVSAAPPLTSEQRDKLAALLRPAGGGAV